MQNSSKETKHASALLLAGELPPALEGSWPLTAGSLESGDPGKQLKLGGRGERGFISGLGVRRSHCYGVGDLVVFLGQDGTMLHLLF